MKNTNTTINSASTAFGSLKRNLETAITSGNDYTHEIAQLATAIATACINKCIDPQRTTATARDKVSNNGHNPAMTAVKHGIHHDTRLLDNTRHNADSATDITYSADGDLVTAIADKTAYNAYNDLISDTLTDGIDLVQTATLAILEQYADHYDGQDNWLDSEYTIRRLSKRVYIQRDDSAQYRDDTTTPIQEVYRAVRRVIQSSRAIQTDPRNGYTYIEDTTPDGLDAILYRSRRYADIGGVDRDGNYTGDMQTRDDINDMLDALNLSSRQEIIINLRMSGYGYKAIATYLGVTRQAVQNALAKIQRKALDLGYTPIL